ncbi:GGDEF domain-containing protein [Paracholeplasma manati]|uniref:GGDEF domain-containing protein n=1 Tax=Paracholeplasma manati TaxID=591373 RepID=UPI0024083194|nr:GGDEF domain-containing protein [Paracholeplasma manati]MDG0889254.1 GGDEF domain-containing protein [Paracholeplasma manati]
MDGLLKRIKVFLITFITLLSLLTIFGIYSPLSKTIEKEKRMNFITAAEIYRDSVQSFITISLQDANIIASDYDTKQMMKGYWEGNISQAEITAYFTASFPANMALFDYVVYAEIGTNNFVLSTYGSPVETYTYHDIIFDFYDHELIPLSTGYVLRVTYPVTMNFTNVGYLMIYFDLSSAVLSSENITLDLYKNDSFIQSVYAESKRLEVNGDIIYVHDDHVDYVGAFNGNQIFYVISMTNADLYGNTNSIVKYAILGLMLVIFLAFIVFNTSVYQKAGSIIQETNLLKDEITQIADIDSLTGAYSRSFFDRYAAAFEQRYADGWVASLIMIDFDNLKAINDTYGHLAGDTVLQNISKLIQESLRANDLFFRFGGDEFVVILEDCERELAEKIAKRLNVEIQKASESLPYVISISYGISMLSHDSNLKKVIHEADVQMYLDKKQKNQKDYDLFDV